MKRCPHCKASTRQNKAGKTDLDYAFAIEVSQFPNVTFVSLDKSLAETAAEIAATYRLCGSEAVYAAVAKRFATSPGLA